MKLTPSQSKAIPLLLSGMKYKDIAKQLNISPQTISSWNNDPEFVAYVNRQRADALSGTRALLQSLTREAVRELYRIALHAENEEVRRKAIMDILHLTGFDDPKCGLYALEIGPQTSKQVQAAWYREANPLKARHLGVPDFE